MKKNKTVKNIVAVVLIAFALVTIFMSSAVLFDWFDIRAKQGNYVLFIVKTNFTAGFLYLIAAYGFIKSYKWSFWVMLSIALLLFYTTALFYLHIHTGGLYESRTMVAIIFRVLFTLLLAGFIYGTTNRKAWLVHKTESISPIHKQERTFCGLRIVIWNSYGERKQYHPTYTIWM